MWWKGRSMELDHRKWWGRFEGLKSFHLFLCNSVACHPMVGLYANCTEGQIFAFCLNKIPLAPMCDFNVL